MIIHNMEKKTVRHKKLSNGVSQSTKLENWAPGYLNFMVASTCMCALKRAIPAITVWIT